jgi:hypothetical protein
MRLREKNSARQTNVLHRFICIRKQAVNERSMVKSTSEHSPNSELSWHQNAEETTIINERFTFLFIIRSMRSEDLVQLHPNSLPWWHLV